MVGLGCGGWGGYQLGTKGKPEMNDTINLLRKKISDLESEIKTKSTKISQLESEVDELKKSGGDDTQKLKDEIQNLKNKISQKEQEIIHLNGKISSNSEIITNMTNTIKQKEKEVEDAKLALAGGNEAIQKIIKETHAKATSLENTNLILNKQLIETNKNFEALTNIKNVLATEKDNLANENKKQKKDLEKLKKENEELKNKGKENDNAEVKIYKAVYDKLNKLLDKYGAKLDDYSNDESNLKSLFIDIDKYIAFGTTLTDLLGTGKCYKAGSSYKRLVAPLCILALKKDLREEDRTELNNMFLTKNFSIDALNQFLTFTPKVNGDGKQPDWKKAYDKNVEGMIGLGVRLSRKLADMVDKEGLYKKNGILDYELTEEALPKIKLTRKSKE